MIKFWKCQTFGGEEWKYAFNIKRLTLNVMSSVVEPEPDFLAGAGASEKARLRIRLRAVAVWLRGIVVAK